MPHIHLHGRHCIPDAAYDKSPRHVHVLNGRNVSFTMHCTICGSVGTFDDGYCDIHGCEQVAVMLSVTRYRAGRQGAVLHCRTRVTADAGTVHSDDEGATRPNWSSHTYVR